MEGPEWSSLLTLSVAQSKGAPGASSCWRNTVLYFKNLLPSPLAPRKSFHQIQLWSHRSLTKSLTNCGPKTTRGSLNLFLSTHSTALFLAGTASWSMCNLKLPSNCSILCMEQPSIFLASAASTLMLYLGTYMVDYRLWTGQTNRL